MKKAIVAALLIAAGVVHAQSTDAKKQLVAKVLQLQQPAIEQLAAGIALQPAQILMQQAGVALQQRIPPDKRQAVAQELQADVKRYADETVPMLRERAVALGPSTIGVLLDERFTEDELKQLIAIMESPINRKFQQMNGEMQRSLTSKLGAEVQQVLQSKFQALDRAMGQRLGLPAPAAQPPTGAASK